MRSHDIFNKITCADTLLSFDGIIPSLSDFQEKLIALIEQFSFSLKAEKHLVIEVERLCHQVCHYLDIRVSHSLQSKDLKWDDYLLLHHFYGYPTPALTDNISLEALLNSHDETISQYAIKLLALSCNLHKNDEHSLQLLALYQHKLVKPEPIKQDDDITGRSQVEERFIIEETDEAEISTKKRQLWHTPALPIMTTLLLILSLWYLCSHYLGNPS